METIDDLATLELDGAENVYDVNTISRLHARARYFVTVRSRSYLWKLSAKKELLTATMHGRRYRRTISAKTNSWTASSLPKWDRSPKRIAVDATI